MIYRVRRFSEDNGENKGMGWGKKALIGAGVLGTAVGGVMAGRAGMLGTGVQKFVGTNTARLGGLMKSKALVNDGAKTVSKSVKTQGLKDVGVNSTKDLLAMRNDADYKKAFDAVKSSSNEAKQGIMNKFGGDWMNAAK